MFECCPLIYIKYISKDNVIDKERQAKALYILYNNGKISSRTMKELFIKPCNCICHKDGENIIH
jgi:hypothetical protein